MMKLSMKFSMKSFKKGIYYVIKIIVAPFFVNQLYEVYREKKFPSKFCLLPIQLCCYIRIIDNFGYYLKKGGLMILVESLDTTQKKII